MGGVFSAVEGIVCVSSDASGAVTDPLGTLTGLFTGATQAKDTSCHNTAKVAVPAIIITVLVIIGVVLVAFFYRKIKMFFSPLIKGAIWASKKGKEKRAMHARFDREVNAEIDKEWEYTPDNGDDHAVEVKKTA